MFDMATIVYGRHGLMTRRDDVIELLGLLLLLLLSFYIGGWYGF